ncbi:MAG: chloride channel protein [Thaumarchaeota archaeon]|nr:chloride channel protein [Nitrososphaerota archaeon]
MVFVGAVAVGIGAAGALIAAALLYLIGFFTNLFYYGRVSFQFVSPSGTQLGDFALLVPLFGGIVVGVLAKYGSERIRGHGIPEALESILINKSRIEPKVTVLKPIATAVSIGSGGPFGAEGPIIMTGGSFGSVLGQMLKLSSSERKTLLVSGAAAGMAATFNTPVAAVLLAVELLLFEWKPRSLIPVGLASVTATVFRWSILGSGPLFPVPISPLPDLTTMASAAVVGLIAGLASTILTFAVYASEDAFKKLPIHWMWWPAIGGLVVGLGGLLAPRALGVGYDTIGLLLLGNLAVGAASVLLVVKGIIWSVSLGSGTSGGVLAPLLMIGGALGAVEALFLPPGSASLLATVSMGAMLGGVMRSPFTGVVFTLELTRNVNVLPLLLVAAIVADFVTVFTMKRSILTEKVARQGVHVSREYEVDVLEQIPVSRVMHREFEKVERTTPVDVFLSMLTPETLGDGYPVVGDDGKMIDYLSRAEITKLMKGSQGLGLTVGELAAHPKVIAYPDEPTKAAVDRLAETDAESLPVVDPDDISEVVGIFSRDDAFRARVIWFKEERSLERHLSVASWLSRFMHGSSKGGAGERS